MQKIILIGAGGQARACIDVIEQCKKYRIAGLISKKEKAVRKKLRIEVLLPVEAFLKRK